MTGSLGSLVAAFKIPDLRRRILFVFGMFAVFVVGVHIPIPNVSREAMERLFAQGGNLLGLFDVFSGGALRKFSIFAMGIIPYINASIIFQLLGIASPRIQQLAREGPSGQRKIGQYTRYLTMALAFGQAWGVTLMLRGQGVIIVPSVLHLLPMTITLTAGTAFLMWLGEQITDQGIGNGVSLIIFAGIMARVPYDVTKTWEGLVAGVHGVDNILFMAALFVVTVLAIVYMQQGQRKIPIQHAKRVVGSRIYSGANTHLPLRVNSAGVIPIIFAISISIFPATIAQFLPQSDTWLVLREWLVRSGPGESKWGSAVYFLLVIFFTYFYTAVTFNVEEVSDNLKKNGGYVPGIRPGKPTRDYLDRVLVRLTLAGALFLGVIALMQYYVGDITGVKTYTLVGGTSLLIVVGVALETMQAIEGQLVMRHYQGFIR
ncbi:MAG TPA: preprotein translocase subunit SecY [Armatimonadota bacterium]|nr:preprotein translocase subunit SecY [Armatimonadota bacterium]